MTCVDCMVTWVVTVLGLIEYFYFVCGCSDWSRFAFLVAYCMRVGDLSKSNADGPRFLACFRLHFGH